MLVVEGGAGPVIARYRDVMRRHGSEFREFSPRELRDRYPAFRFPPDSRGLLDPSGAVLYADKCMQALQVGSGSV